MARWDETHRFAVDAWFAAIVTFFMVIVTAGLGSWEGTSPEAAVVWAILLGFPLAWRRTRPVGSAVAVLGTALVHLMTGSPLILPADLMVVVAIYSVTVHGPRWAYRAALAGGLAGAAVLGGYLTIVEGGGLDGGILVTILTGLTVVSAFTVGLVRRARRETIQALVDRAERLEVERDQAARISTAAERTRIAREMHDIVAHSLSVVVAQADGGRYAAEQDPAAAIRSLTTISETGRAALTDMRRLLGVLRAPGEDGTGTPAPALAPQPATGELTDLVAQVRAAGLRVSLVQLGTAPPLPPGTGLTLFRICQESLTNILKHAGPDPTATLMVTWRPQAVEIRVTDDGRGAAAATDGAGQGVLGMRERAVMLGGTLSAGPRPGGGYQVVAHIPLTGAALGPVPPPVGPTVTVEENR